MKNIEAVLDTLGARIESLESDNRWKERDNATLRSKVETLEAELETLKAELEEKKKAELQLSPELLSSLKQDDYITSKENQSIEGSVS